MARKPSSSSRNTAANRRSQSAGSGKPGTRKGRNPRAQKAADAKRDSRKLIDEYAKRDIVGIAFTVAAVVLFIATVMRSDAIVTSFVSSALHLTLGIGAYILPLFLLAIGITFLIRFEAERVPTRVAVGLALVFVALLAVFALATPLPEGGDPAGILFNEHELTVRGGYIGAGIAWLGITLFGQVISMVIVIGVAVAGVCIIGFSISKLIEKIRESRAERRAEEGAGASFPFARIRRNSKGIDTADDEAPEVDSSAETRVIAAHPLATPESIAQGTSSSAKNRTLGRAERKAARLAELEEQQASTSDGGEVQPASMPTRRIEPIEGASSSLTRKLGKKADSDAAAPQEEAPKPKKAARAKLPASAPTPLEGFTLPSMDLLSYSNDPEKDRASEIELQDTAAHLQETLANFHIMADVVGWVAGPTVTLFKVDLPAGVRVSRVTALSDDIALALAAPGVRIFAPIPGTNYVGIEVPNRTRQTVFLGDVLKDADGGPLLMAIGKDVEGTSIITDLAKMPHLLIGVTTGT